MLRAPAAVAPREGPPGRPAAPPLYLAASAADRPPAQQAFDSPRASPPLDYRNSAAAAAAIPGAEPEPPRPAYQAAPPPAVDLDALSRDVVRRLEKRLRIERERRGRS